MNQTDLAAEFEVSRRTIQDWDKEGLREAARVSSRPVEYDPLQAWRWRWANKREEVSSVKDAKVRKLEAEAEAKELELAVRRGELLEVVDVVKTWDEVLARLRSKIVAFEGSLPPLLVGFGTAREVKAVVGPMFAELLEVLRGTAEELTPDG